jgi:hypothetical protein
VAEVLLSDGVKERWSGEGVRFPAMRLGHLVDEGGQPVGELGAWAWWLSLPVKDFAQLRSREQRARAL